MGTDTTSARSARSDELQAVKTKKEFIAIGQKAGITIDPALKMVEMVKLILDAEFPAAASGDKASAPPAPTAVQAPTAPANSGEGVSKDPLQAKQDELDARLGELYDSLVEQIKAAAETGVKTDTAEQIRAGAVQFLRQCNATLGEARQFVEDARKVNEANNKQLQSIEKANKDLEKRSDAYKAMTIDGVKNQQ